MIYLDNASTTKVSSKVFQKMKPYFISDYANPNTPHQMGIRARVAVESARKYIAEAIGAEPNEIIFTSGTTESNNTVISIIKGLARQKAHMCIFSSISSHPSTYVPIQQLENKGLNVTWLPLSKSGDINFNSVHSSNKNIFCFVSLSHVCSETGVISDISFLHKKLRSCQNTIVHLDVTQSIGKLRVNVSDLDVDYMSFSAHKFHGPKGVGVLYIRSGAIFDPLLFGGGQEENRRSGSINTAGIVGTAEALRESIEKQIESQYKVSKLKKILVHELKHFFEKRVIIHGGDVSTSPYITLFTVLSSKDEGYPQEALLYGLDLEGICISAGTACSSGSLSPSPTLQAMGGLNESQIRSSIRVSFSRYSTLEHVYNFIKSLKKVILRLDNRLGVV